MFGDDFLAAKGYSTEAEPAESEKRFPDGAHFRVEIPSVEGPRVLEAVVEAAQRFGITVNRVSQGSGAMLLSSAEIREMVELGEEQALEVSLFVGPRQEYDIGNHSRALDGASLAGQQRSVRQLRYALEDVARAADLGIRSFLIADIGLLSVLHELQQGGVLPADIVWKVSVMQAPSNPASLRVIADLGASTANIPSDTSLGELAEFRTASSIPLDLYVESPDAMAGVVRGQEMQDLIRVGAPLYVKFGLRNSRPLYPSGEHLVAEASAIAREKVHRAAVALEWVQRLAPELVQSKPGATGLGVPTSTSGWSPDAV